MNDYYDYQESYYDEAGINPTDDYWFEDGDDEVEEYDYQDEPLEDFGYFGEMGMWD